MAKKKQKSKQKRRKKQRRALAGNALLGTFAGGVAGKVLERLIVQELETLIRPLRKHWRHDDGGHAKALPNGRLAPGSDGDDDPASRLLTVLAEGGPKGIPQLLGETNLGLSRLLHALHILRDFRLVNFVGEPGEEVVEVTRSGSGTVTVLRKNDI